MANRRTFQTHGVVGALIGVVAVASISSLHAQQPLPALASLVASDRVLIVAPHPDDESLCCAGLIRRTLTTGGSVAIVWITSGDAFELDAMVIERTLRPRAAGLEMLALMRMNEARAAAAKLGVPTSKQFFLGYPDRGLRQLLARRERVFRSRYTGADHVPYDGTLAQGSAYTGSNLERDLSSVIAKFKPTLVFAPSAADVHPDHRATSELLTRVLTPLRRQGIARYWVVHGGEGWPAPTGLHRELRQTPPPVALQAPWQRLTLTADEQDSKLAAIRRHRTQLEVMGKKMLSFVRQDELYLIEPMR
jgi:LmbE family N-acetylglucosaminyl deacetylase